jgi:hypothetical protein
MTRRGIGIALIMVSCAVGGLPAAAQQRGAAPMSRIDDEYLVAVPRAHVHRESLLAPAEQAPAPTLRRQFEEFLAERDIDAFLRALAPQLLGGAAVIAEPR